MITSYAVAEAITVPLTGWLAKRFGAQRMFIVCYLGFAVVSLLCGLSNSLGMLLGMRVLLGLVGGPIMPLSQMLLLRIFPKEKATLATVLWAMTTLVGPVAGPDPRRHHLRQLSAGSGSSSSRCRSRPQRGLPLMFLMRGQPDPKCPAFIDKVGLGLLVIWVGALQIMLDEGRNHDWFASPEIRVLGVIAAIGFVAFLIWELTEKNPIVDLQDLPTPRLRRRRRPPTRSASAPSSPASSSCRSGCRPTWATPRPGPATRPASWASSRCAAPRLSARRSRSSIRD